MRIKVQNLEAYPRSQFPLFRAERLADFIRRGEIPESQQNKIRFFMLTPKNDAERKTAATKKLLLEKLFVEVVEIPQKAGLDYNSAEYYRLVFKR